MKLSAKQLIMLRDYHRDGEASDLGDFAATRRSGDALAWRNRERVIDALRRKGLLNDDGITPEGIAVLRETR